MGTRILLVEDDPTISEVVASYLEHDGHEVERVSDGVSALQRASTGHPDLVVLDVMLPGIDGLEVCRRLRESSQVPVILLTALGSESDRVVGLEHGADDYVTKPFSPRELVLRVKAVLRRTDGSVHRDEVAVLIDGGLVVDRWARRATLAGDELLLTTREFDLLAFLLEHPGLAFDRQALLAKVWGWDFGDSSTVTVHVRRLRGKIEQDPAVPRRIVTVWGTGYRYETQDQSA